MLGQFEVDGVGDDFTDEDKQAQKEFEDAVIPNPYLLKARVLFDGAQYLRSLNAIAGVPVENFATARDQVEQPGAFGGDSAWTPDVRRGPPKWLLIAAPLLLLAAMGVDRSVALGALRLTLGHTTTVADVDRVVDVVGASVDQLRRRMASAPIASSS